MDNTGDRFSAGGAVCTALPGYYPSADAPGLVPVRRGFCVVLLKDQKVPVSPQVNKDRLLGHGFVRTGDSRADVRSRIGYRPVDTATGFPCFARKHEQPLAS